MSSHIDLYRAHGLDRQRSCLELDQQLKSQHKGTDPRETVARARIDVARAVLGAGPVRQKYDRWLADPTAPPITEKALAELAAEGKKHKSKGDWIAGAIGVAFGLS